jgi:hypothetical protein
MSRRPNMKVRFDPAVLRAAWWALRAQHRARRGLQRQGLQCSPLPSPPRLAARAEHGVHAVLRRTGATCLVRAMVLQKWQASSGPAPDVVIGVTAPSRGFRAHAWLDGEPACHSDGFEELTRLPSPSAP